MNEPENRPAPGTDINAPELDALAADFDGTTSDTEAGSAAHELDNARMCAFALEMVAGAAATVYPSVSDTASPERIQPVAVALGAVMDKYGFSAGGWFERYAVEINAIAAVSVFGMSVYAGIRTDIEKAEERKRAKPEEQGGDGRQQ